MISSMRPTKIASEHPAQPEKKGICKPALARAARKWWKDSAREDTTIEHLVAIFTMFLVKVLVQITKLCLKNAIFL